jgi:hypothetical protein
MATCVNILDDEKSQYNHSTHTDSHTMRRTWHYSDHPTIRRMDDSTTKMTDVDMKHYDRLNIKGELPFFKLEEDINENSIDKMTKEKPVYHGKSIEYSVPVSYVEQSEKIPNDYFLCQTMEERTSSFEKSHTYDDSMIYLINGTQIRELRQKTTPIRDNLEKDTTSIMYGVINPETKNTSLYKNPIIGTKNMITFDFGSYKEITHIETFGRYPSWISFSKYFKKQDTPVFNKSVFKLSKSKVANIGICTSDDPFYYVKKYEVQYRDVFGKWRSVGTFTGNYDIISGRLQQVNVYTRFLRIIPIDYCGKIPSMEIIIFGKQKETLDVSKNDTSFIKYNVFIPTKYAPDGFGMRQWEKKSSRVHYKKLTTKQYLDEFSDE